MCGLIGSYNFDISMQDLLLQQQYRGPDASGECVVNLSTGQLLHLGHNRLKILCLTDNANQPFIDDTQQHYLIFNGEIYNYRELRQRLQAKGVSFYTTSDSEVLLLALRQWGIEAIKQFNGMFAFAYFNRITQQLYLVRDRFGIKPLYYYHRDNQLLFASTSELIAKTCQLQPNYAYLKQGLHYGIYEDHSAMTAYQDLHAVPSGSIVTFSLAQASITAQITPYYDLGQAVKQTESSIVAISDEQLLDQVAQLLQDANHLRLQADVPVAVALSGGLDSATIAAISKQQNANIEGFCFGHPHDPRSEGPLAAKVASMHAIKMHYVHATAAEWHQAISETLRAQDAPFYGLSVVAQYLLYQKIKQVGFKVVLGGQGGDEAFLGYRKFQWFYLQELIAQQNWFAAMHFFGAFSTMLWAEKYQLARFWKLRARYTQQNGQQSTLHLPGEALTVQMGSRGHLQARQIADVLQYSLPTLLRYEDRNSMFHSIESRLPFMDYRLIELACALPVRLKLKKGYGKWAIRQIMANQLPNEIRLARYKRGFDVQNNSLIDDACKTLIQTEVKAHQKFIQTFVRGNINDYFHPHALKKSQQRFAELMTLLWLSTNYAT